MGDSEKIKSDEMNELKPCPFCGGKAEVVGGSDYWTPSFDDPDSGGSPIAVVCKCGVTVGFFDDYDKAIAAWSHRANEMPEEIKQLKERAEKAEADMSDLRNYACELCGKYKTAHFGSCDGCRYKRKETEETK